MPHPGRCPRGPAGSAALGHQAAATASSCWLRHSGAWSSRVLPRATGAGRAVTVCPRNKRRFAAGPLGKQQWEPRGHACCWEHTLCGHLGGPHLRFCFTRLSSRPRALLAPCGGCLTGRGPSAGQAPQGAALPSWDDQMGPGSGNWGCWGKCGIMATGECVLGRTQAGTAVSESKGAPQNEHPKFLRNVPLPPGI